MFRDRNQIGRLARRRPLWVPSGEALPIWEIDFTTYAPGAIATPAGWTFTRATHVGTSITVQTSDTTVANLGAVDSMRIGQFGSDNTTRGFVIEPPSLSYVNFPLSLTAFGAGSGMTATLGSVDPAGGTFGWRCELTSGGCSGSMSSGYVHTICSMWAKATSTTKRQTSKANATVFDQTIDTAWRRVTVGDSLGAAFYPSDAGAQTGIMGARDTTLAFFQMETAKEALQAQILFPTEFMRRGDGSQAARNQETLTLNAIAPLISLGRLSLAFEACPKGSSAQYTDDMPIVVGAAAGSPTVSIVTGTRLLKVACGGSTWTSAVAMTWAEKDTIQIFVECGDGVHATRAAYRVKPRGSSVWGATISLGVGSVQAAAVSTGAMKLACGLGGSVSPFAAWVRKVSAYASGQKPAWAA